MSVRKKVTGLAQKAHASIEARVERGRVRDAESAADIEDKQRTAEKAEQAKRQEWETATAEGPKRLAEVAMEGAGLIVVFTPRSDPINQYDPDGIIKSINSELGLGREGGGPKSLAISVHDHPWERNDSWVPPSAFSWDMAHRISEASELRAIREDGNEPTVITPNSSPSADRNVSSRFRQVMNRGIDNFPLAAGAAEAVETGRDVLNNFHGHEPSDVGHIVVASSISFKDLGIPGEPIGDSGLESPPNSGSGYAFTGPNPDTGAPLWRQIHPPPQPPG